jgi:energy-converting hydrogenase Eha subunit E
MVITVEVVLGVIAIYTLFPSIVMMITPTATTSVTTMMMRCIVWVDAVDHNSSNHNSF